jgi:hypothetical protein
VTSLAVVPRMRVEPRSRPGLTSVDQRSLRFSSKVHSLERVSVKLPSAVPLAASVERSACGTTPQKPNPSNSRCSRVFGYFPWWDQADGEDLKAFMELFLDAWLNPDRHEVTRHVAVT